MSYRSINPFTGIAGSEFPVLSDNQLAEKIESAASAFIEWRKTSVAMRARLVSGLGRVLLENESEYAALITSEMGKPLAQSLGEVRKCAAACDYYALNGEKFLSAREMISAGGKSIIRYDPLGVVLAVMPWNFPFWQVIRCIVPAMLAGNSLLLKHASNVPGSALAIQKAVEMAGFPAGLFTSLFVTHDQVNRIIDHKAVKSVSLTGSNHAGESVAAAAGSRIKSCVLELGGSDPFIVYPDADIERAAREAITGRFQNNGQSCIATKRIYLHENIYDRFMKRFVEGVNSLVMGDPMAEGVDIGPMVNRQAAEELSLQVKRSVAMGARIVAGTGELPAEGSLFRPVVMVDVPDDAPVATEETFGPAVPVFRFSDYDDMIMRVNSSRFGLGSSVWTTDSDLAMRLSADIVAGTVTINGYTRSDPALPFGGVKESGFGRELSDTGLYEFVNIKTVTIF